MFFKCFCKINCCKKHKTKVHSLFENGHFCWTKKMSNFTNLNEVFKTGFLKNAKMQKYQRHCINGKRIFEWAKKQ